MRRSLHGLAPLLALSWLLAAPAARAEQFRSFGDYEVHYNAVRSDFIDAGAAAQHGLTRSATRGLLNVAVLRRTADGGRRHLEATLAASVRGGDGEPRPVRMRPVREPGVLYYIGEFRIAGEDTYRFDIEVTPADGTERLRIRFSQALLAE